MNLRVVGAGVLVLLTALLLGQAAAPSAPPASPQGRYQVSSAATPVGGDVVCLVDTATGDTWYRDSADGKWKYTGNPTKDPGLRAETATGHE